MPEAVAPTVPPQHATAICCIVILVFVAMLVLYWSLYYPHPCLRPTSFVFLYMILFTFFSSTVFLYPLLKPTILPSYRFFLCSPRYYVANVTRCFITIHCYRHTWSTTWTRFEIVARQDCTALSLSRMKVSISPKIQAYVVILIQVDIATITHHCRLYISRKLPLAIDACIQANLCTRIHVFMYQTALINGRIYMLFSRLRR